MCHFRVLADTETIAEIGADLRLYNTDQGPHQDPNVGNFEPPQGTNQTCDSYLSGINGGNSINHEKSFIRWGVQAPYVVNAIWIINPGQEWPPQSDSVALQVAHAVVDDDDNNDGDASVVALQVAERALPR